MARLADELITATQQRRPGQKIICASGLSPSGHIHLGNLREVMTPHLVADEVARRGYPVEHIISWDDYDRFRKVPFGVEGIDESWNAYIGMPLTSVPAPRGSQHPNWAEHFKAEMSESLAQLGVEFRGISQTQMYTSGAYVQQVLHAMAHREDIDAVLAQYRTKTEAPVAALGDTGIESEQDAEAARAAAEGSGAADEDDGSGGTGGYFPFKPYSRAFGTDATRVTSYDPATTELRYVATGPNGEQVEEVMHLDRDFHGKLVWKVDWPMRWAYEGVDFEPSGVDHQSPGSSYVVGGQIVGPIFGGWQPLGPMYAFVGISGMAKMSSSKGGVPTPADALAIMEPHVLRWLYARRRPNQSFSVAFDNTIHRLYDEWDQLERKVAGGKGQPGDEAMYTRSVRTAARELPRTPVPVGYKALCSIVDITGGHEGQMSRILGSLDPAITDLDKARPRLDLAATWVASQADPHDRTTVREQPDQEALAGLSDHERESLQMLVADLENDWSLEGLTSLAYGVPKRQAGFDVGEKKLPPEVKADQRAFFALLYRLLLGAETGPRIPTLLLCLGPDKVRTLLGH
uniref:lysine--tRNA ligase n=1 Tax=Gephyromycinifex aptenodytis TaxID=2716227 RepID=UPI001447BA41|nr:lysine--tRNA ligase [Gephyromycinifex aptenodytis]